MGNEMTMMREITESLQDLEMSMWYRRMARFPYVATPTETPGMMVCSLLEEAETPEILQWIDSGFALSLIAMPDPTPTTYAAAIAD